jgi:PA domain.
MKNRIFLFLLTITLLVPSVALAQDVKISAAERKIAETITADQLSNWLHFVASDAMAGRDTPSMGLDVTAEFLKMNLQKWGFKPAGDNGTFFQTMAMTRESIDADKTLVTLGGQTYKLNDDFFKIGGNGSAENAGMVFGGNGWMVKSKNYDALAGVDVKGKIVVLYSEGFPSGRSMTQLPKGITQADLTGTRGTDYADPMTNARAKGAAGVLLIASPQVEQGWANIRGFFSRGSLYVDKLRDANAGTGTLPGMLVSEKLGAAILAGESGNKASETAFAINKTATVSAVAKKEALKNSECRSCMGRR